MIAPGHATFLLLCIESSAGDQMQAWLLKLHLEGDLEPAEARQPDNRCSYFFRKACHLAAVLACRKQRHITVPLIPGTHQAERFNAPTSCQPQTKPQLESQHLWHAAHEADVSTMAWGGWPCAFKIFVRHAIAVLGFSLPAQRPSRPGSCLGRSQALQSIAHTSSPSCPSASAPLHSALAGAPRPEYPCFNTSRKNCHPYSDQMKSG